MSPLIWHSSDCSNTGITFKFQPQRAYSCPTQKKKHALIVIHFIHLDFSINETLVIKYSNNRGIFRLTSVEALTLVYYKAFSGQLPCINFQICGPIVNICPKIPEDNLRKSNFFFFSRHNGSKLHPCTFYSYLL